MSTTSAHRQARRAAFAQLVALYHNDFAGLREGVYEHSAQFIENVVANAGADLATAVLSLDPRLTSTDTGAVAFAIAKAVAEDKRLAPEFLDVEVVGDGRLVVYFEEKANPELIRTVLGGVGGVGILARPGERLSENIVADLFAVVVEPGQAVAESVVAEMRKRMGPKKAVAKALKDEKPCVEHDEVVVQGEPIKVAVELNHLPTGRPENLSEGYDDAAECRAAGLDAAVYGDEALSACAATPAQVAALFAEAFGERAQAQVAAAVVEGSKAPSAGDDYALRNRMIRALAAHGYVAGVAESSLPAAAAVEVDKFFEDRREDVDRARRGELDGSVYEAMVDDLAVAIDAAMDGDAVYESFVERVVDLRLPALDAGRRAALAERVRRAGKDVAEHQEVVARALRAVARTVMVENGLLRSPELVEAAAAVASYVADAAAGKQPPAADPLLCVVDSILGLEA